MKYSIRYKFAIGLLVVFGLSYVFMNYSINKLIADNNEEIISKELLSSQKDLNIYLKQYLLINKIEVDNGWFEKNASKISDALVSKLNSRITMFNSTGQKIYDSNEGTVNNKLTNLKYQDISQYKIVNGQNKGLVDFYQPVYIDDKVIGFVNYRIDYSDLFQSKNNLLRNIKLFMFIVFSIIFTVVLILTRKIITPIIMLNRNAKEIAKGNFDMDVKVTSKDEVGELGVSFNQMRSTIKDQIETIEKDRDDLIKLEGHRKVFFDNVTHEIKTPLTIISGYLQMIMDEEKSNKLVIKAASKAKIQSDRLHYMIINLIENSKIKSEIDFDNLGKIDMSSLISSVCDDMSIKAEKYEIVIKRQFEEEIFIFANREEIVRLLINILDNSIKYGDVKSKINIKLYEEKGNCIIIVNDEGKGIAEKDLNKLFEPFYRSKGNSSNENGSIGLGLTIVKSIIDKYQGTINIESKESIGTKVYIKIPLFTKRQQLD